MEFRIKRRVKIEEVPTDYPHVLQLFKNPPTGDVSLEEFETMAYDRLKLLRILEQATLMGHKLYSVEWKTAIINYLKKDGLRKYVHLIQSTGGPSEAETEGILRREDHISHFILRLCYCRSQDLRSWFLSRELELFKLRFLNLSTEGVKNFMKVCKLDYTPISYEEKDSIKDGLVESTAGHYLVNVEVRDFYKVPFNEVSDLVARKMVYLKRGFAYIPSNELVSCVISMYRSELNEKLAKASKRLPYIDDERLTGLFQSLHTSYTGRDYSVQEKAKKVSLTDLEMLSKQSFPLCMRNLYESIKTTHHMKHFGRLQFGLFLKGIGVSLEDAITYWKSEFMKLIDEDKFNKSYLYNIKHSYGQIGKMLNYSPYSCMKIIMLSIGPGECHGCPYRHWDNDVLKKKMYEYGMSVEAIREITEISKKGHFQIACSKYFIHTHGGIESKALISHPNQFFEESREIRTNSRDKFQRRMVQNKGKHKTSVAEDTYQEMLDVDMVEALDSKKIDKKNKKLKVNEKSQTESQDSEISSSSKNTQESVVFETSVENISNTNKTIDEDLETVGDSITPDLTEGTQ